MENKNHAMCVYTLVSSGVVLQEWERVDERKQYESAIPGAAAV